MGHSTLRYSFPLLLDWEHAVAQLVDGFIGIFHWHTPSGLGLTQPLTEMSTRNVSWGVLVAGAYGWQPYRLHVPIDKKSWSLNLLEPSGPVQACNRRALPLLLLDTIKGKTDPLQAQSGPEGSRKLWFPDFVTTAQDGGKVVSLTHRPPLPPGNTPGTHFC